MITAPIAAPSTRYLLDANILLRRIEPAHSHHAIALQAVRDLLTTGQELFVAPQSIYEFWTVATRPLSVNGLGLSINEAVQDVTRIETLFTLLPDETGVYPQWRRLVVTYSVQGKPAHDARLVAFMLTHGITHLLTFNGSDFGRYTSEGITVVDPAQISAPTP